MASSKLIIGFARYADDELDNKALEIIKGMTGNATFPTPTPPLADVQASLTAYQDALSQASKGGVDKTVIKKLRRTELEALLKRLAMYVEEIAQGNEITLMSSGFDLAKPREPRGILQKPAKIKVGNGPVPGSVKVSADVVAGAESYLFECTLAPVTETSNWNKEAATARNFTFLNLVRGKEYVFRVAGIGSNPLRVYSDTVNLFVQ